MSAAAQAAEQHTWAAAARAAIQNQPPPPPERCHIVTQGRTGCGCTTCTRELITQLEGQP